MSRGGPRRAPPWLTGRSHQRRSRPAGSAFLPLDGVLSVEVDGHWIRIMTSSSLVQP
jgi:hypothetical protein